MRVASLAALLLLLLLGLLLGLLFVAQDQSQVQDEEEDEAEVDLGPQLEECLRHRLPLDTIRCARSIEDQDKFGHDVIVGFLRRLRNKLDPEESSSDARLASLGLTPSPNFCRESHFVDVSPLRTKRPVLLYPVGLVPELRSWSNRPARLQGLAKGKLFPAFSSNPRRFRFNTPKNCSGYHDWVRRNLHLWSDAAADLKVAIVMDGSLWCPKSFITAAKVVIADLYEEDVKLTEYSCERVYKIGWALWRKGSYGIVPKKFQHVFL